MEGKEIRWNRTTYDPSSLARISHKNERKRRIGLPRNKKGDGFTRFWFPTKKVDGDD